MGLSQESLGSAIGVTFQQIQKYERGITRVSSSRLFEFAHVLEVPISFFFDDFTATGAGNDNTKVMQAYAAGMAEEKAPAFKPEEYPANRETLEMVRAYCKIKDNTVRKKIFELIKTVATTE